MFFSHRFLYECSGSGRERGAARTGKYRYMGDEFNAAFYFAADVVNKGQDGVNQMSGVEKAQANERLWQHQLLLQDKYHEIQNMLTQHKEEFWKAWESDTQESRVAACAQIQISENATTEQVWEKFCTWKPELVTATQSMQSMRQALTNTGTARLLLTDL